MSNDLGELAGVMPCARRDQRLSRNVHVDEHARHFERRIAIASARPRIEVITRYEDVRSYRSRERQSRPSIRRRHFRAKTPVRIVRTFEGRKAVCGVLDSELIEAERALVPIRKPASSDWRVRAVLPSWHLFSVVERPIESKVTIPRAPQEDLTPVPWKLTGRSLCVRR